MNERQQYRLEVWTGTTGAAYFLHPNNGSVVMIDHKTDREPKWLCSNKRIDLLDRPPNVEQDGRPVAWRMKIPRGKLWLTPTAPVPCRIAANIGECKTWTQSEFCTWQNSVRGKSPRKCIYNVPAQETAKHRAKFGWPPSSDVGAVTKPRRETRWNLLGCPKLANRSQPLVGRSSPYCEHMWRRYYF